MAKELIWSEESDFVYGRAVEFENKEDFINTVKDQYEDGECEVADVKIQPCVWTERTIPKECLVTLSSAYAVIENYYTASVSDIE
ncbi:hypothetical protein [Paenibacillus bouchesdurhonensis]|uniref:hypothetical protein n=1 Tax=Paenibacillus bouchesdurhonensis TaxID=1870990 RepID=UPI000DA5FE03|nr:hypothetical protein [Paenibacillus bouchesdurhonensis]